MYLGAPLTFVLYTSIPPEETVEICCDVLFRSSLPKHLMNFATSSVKFSFNNVPADGVAMGSSLGPTLANIFVFFVRLIYSK